MGLELAGVVAAWGDEVEGFERGDRVFGLVGGGAYAEQAVIDYRMAMPIPDDWSFEKAAAVTEVFFTANETLFTLGGLRAGESVLIHAGGSGVGTAGTQMAHHAGARVFITAGSAEKIERSKQLGCTEGINYKEQDFETEIMRADRWGRLGVGSRLHWCAVFKTQSVNSQDARTLGYGWVDGGCCCRT